MFRKIKHTVADGIKDVHIAVASSSVASAASTSTVIDVDAVRATRPDVDVAPRLVAHYGCDASTSAVAHVKHQGIVLLASQHGVKALGRAGFEALYPCRSGVGARAESVFTFGANRIYRASYDDGGTLSVFDARDMRLLACNRVDVASGADVTCVTPIRGTPFVLAGDASGDVSVLRVEFDAQSGTTMAKVRPGYRITAQEALHRVIDTTRARMRVVAIEQQPGLMNEHARILLAYSDGSLAVWHLHEKRSVAVTAPAVKTREQDDTVDGGGNGPALTTTTTTCVTWLDANTTASGRSDGSVVAHSVPALSGCTTTCEITRAQDTVWPYKILDPSYLCGTALMGIRALRTVVSDDADGARLTRNALVVVGGEPRAAPDAVIMLTLVRDSAQCATLGYRIDTTRAKALPWFGPVVDAAPMCDRDDGIVECVAVLSEGGRVHVHDVCESRRNHPDQPSPYTPPPPHEALLSRPMFALSCAPSACQASSEVVATFRRNAACLDAPPGTLDAAHGWRGSSRWPVYGGGDSKPMPRLGDARIVVGACGTNGSGLLVYLDIGGRLVPGGSVLANGIPITCVHAHAGGALVVVGRANGGVEVYSMRAYDVRHPKSRERVFVRRLECDAATSADEERIFDAENARDGRGGSPESVAFVDLDSASACMTSVYTLVGTFEHALHANRRVTSVRANASATMVAVGDSSGGVSLIDLRRGVAAWSAPALALGSKADASPSAGVAGFGFGLPLPEHPDDDVLAVLDAESGVRFHVLYTGARVGAPMRPKSPTEALSIALLKLDGSPADVCSPRANDALSSAGWFTPPADFAYSFLAAEFTVEDDDDDVHEEEKVLSTDEDEADVQPIPERTALVVTVGKNALRVYSAISCARGERFTLRKIRLDETLASAEVARSGDFGHSRDECCVVALTSYGRLLAYALPSFAPLGSPFGPVPALSNANTSTFASDGSGVIVADDGATMARLETWPSDSAPAAGCVIDVDVAAAAEAARVARFAMEENDHELAMETTSKRTSTVGTPPSSSASPAGGTPLRNRMLMLRDRAKVAIEKLAAVTPTKDEILKKKEHVEPVYTTTDLALLFADVVLEAPSPQGKAARPRDTESSERDELFAGSSSRGGKTVASNDVVPVKRSVSSIRAKYRANDADASASASASSDVRDQMLETRDKLVERGEKLSRIQDKSAALEHDAASFADMCAEIRKKSERSWL